MFDLAGHLLAHDLEPGGEDVVVVRGGGGEEEEELPRATTRASQMVSRWKAMMIQYAKALPGPFMQRRARKKCPRRGGFTRMAQSGEVAKAL